MLRAEQAAQSLPGRGWGYGDGSDQPERACCRFSAFRQAWLSLLRAV